MSYQTEFNLFVETISTNTELDNVIDIVKADAVGGSIEITLPIAGLNPGKEYRIKKIDVSFNAVSLIPSGSDTIDGETSFEIGSPQEGYSFISDGVSTWMVF